MEANKQETLDVLERTARFFEKNPEAWGITEFEQPSDWGDYSEFCILGALAYIGTNDSQYFAAEPFRGYPVDRNANIDSACRLLDNASRNRIGHATIADWNDSYAESVDDVIDILRESIEIGKELLPD